MLVATPATSPLGIGRNLKPSIFVHIKGGVRLPSGSLGAPANPTTSPRSLIIIGVFQSTEPRSDSRPTAPCLAVGPSHCDTAPSRDSPVYQHHFARVAALLRPRSWVAVGSEHQGQSRLASDATRALRKGAIEMDGVLLLHHRAGRQRDIRSQRRVAAELEPQMRVIGAAASVCPGPDSNRHGVAPKGF
jgi:hypothetical protein